MELFHKDLIHTVHVHSTWNKSENIKGRVLIINQKINYHQNLHVLGKEQWRAVDVIKTFLETTTFEIT